MRLVSLLWRVGCGLAGLLLFSLTLLLGAPLSFWLDRVERPSDLQLGVAGGDLLHGRLSHLAGPGWRLDALDWQLMPAWPPRGEMTLQVSGQRWRLEGVGWPWQWQASIRPQPGQVLSGAGRSPGGSFVWQGDWQGGITLAGSGRRCRMSSGQLSSDALRLQVPLTADFGRVDLQLRCGETTQLRLQTRGAGQQLQFTADLERRRSRLQGRVTADSRLAEPVRLLGLDPAGSGQIRRGWRW